MQKNQSSEVDVKLPSGNTVTAINLIPEQGGVLAVVPLSVVQRLAAMLPTANLEAIKGLMCDVIGLTNNLDEYMNALQQELDFHKTVNRIATIDTSQVKEAAASWND